MLKLSNLIAKSKNGTEIIVSLIPLHKMQNTRQGSKKIEVGKRVLLSSGIEVDLNLDGRTFYTLIYAELSGDFPLGDSRQPTYKSLRPFDLVS